MTWLFDFVTARRAEEEKLAKQEYEAKEKEGGGHKFTIDITEEPVARRRPNQMSLDFDL